MGWKSTQAWGCPCSIKRLFILYYPFSYWHKNPVMEISSQIQMCPTKRRDLHHSIPFPWGGKLDFGVHYEIRWGYSPFQYRVLHHTILFEYSLWSFTLNTSPVGEQAFVDLVPAINHLYTFWCFWIFEQNSYRRLKHVILKGFLKFGDSF